MELVVYLQDEQDLAIIESLLNRLKLRFEKRHSTTTNPQTEIDREKTYRNCVLCLLKSKILLLATH